MRIFLKKSNGWLENTTLYDWQPVQSNNDTWYRISRKNIAIGRLTPTISLLARQLFNATLLGLTCSVKAKYHRSTKKLEIDL